MSLLVSEDICRSDPCLYGGTCLNGNHFNNGYDCSCVEGTGGDNCETGKHIHLQSFLT